MPEAGAVLLEVFDVQGQLVRRIDAQAQAAGRHTTTLHAGDLPGGLYLVRLSSGAYSQVRQVVLAR